MFKYQLVRRVLKKRSSLFKYSVVINRFDDFSLRIKARLIYLQHPTTRTIGIKSA